MISLITVGDYRDKNLEQLESEYLKRIRTPFHIYPIKAFSEDLNKESQSVIKKVQELEKKTARQKLLS